MMFLISPMMSSVAGIMISSVKPSGVLTKPLMYPMYGIVSMALPMTLSLFTIHVSGSSFALEHQ